MSAEPSPYPWPPPPRSRWHRAGLYLVERSERLLLLVAVVVLGALALVWWLLPGGNAPTESWSAERVDAQAAFSSAGGVPRAAGDEAGTLAVYSFPNGATVYINANAVGTTPLELDDLAQGTYTLTLQAEGYQAVDTVASVISGERTSLILYHEFDDEAVAPPLADASPTPPVTAGARALEPPPASASRPPTPGATPSDRSTRPTPPAQPRPQPPAPSVPRAQPTPPPATGTLAVVVRPWGTILINGTVYARETDVQHATTLPVGEHRVRATHPTLGSREVTVTVQPGRTARVEIDLN